MRWLAVALDGVLDNSAAVLCRYGAHGGAMVRWCTGKQFRSEDRKCCSWLVSTPSTAHGLSPAKSSKPDCDQS